MGRILLNLITAGGVLIEIKVEGCQSVKRNISAKLLSVFPFPTPQCETDKIMSWTNENIKLQPKFKT